MPKNKEVVFLYVKEFTWKNKKDKTSMNGHPVSGRVYRAVKDEEDESYKVYIGKELTNIKVDGIKIYNLVNDTDTWKCDIVELNKNTMLELDITDDDLNMIKITTENNHSDLSDVIKGSKKEVSGALTGNDETEESFLNRLMEEIENTSTELPEGDPLHAIYQIDPLMGETLYELLEYILYTYNDKYTSSPIDVQSMTLDDKFGKGINVFNTIKYLSRYSTDGFPKSNNPSDLTKAVHYLLFESMRRKLYPNND
jgi:hypothetical protein